MPALSDTLKQQAIGVVIGGVVASAGTMAVLSERRAPEIDSSGAEKVTTYVSDAEINAVVQGTGSTTIQYPATCVENPLASTGIISTVYYEAGNQPAAKPADVGLVTDCSDSGGSGQNLINNSCTATGCLSNTTTPTLFGPDQKIKTTFSDDPTTSYTGRLKVKYSQKFE